MLQTPASDALAVWNDAEAPEPPANLTATLKGAVIHRFCETYSSGDNSEDVLRRSFEDIVRKRQAELADRVFEINPDEAIADLLPLAQNYLSSQVFERIERARAALPAASAIDGFKPDSGFGLWSELGFRLRRPLGILTGAIDKLLITRSRTGKGFDVEVIDFKTNRISRQATRQEAGSSSRRQEPGDKVERGQIAFDFDRPAVSVLDRTETSIDDRVRVVAADYQLQMQAYALAVTELLPALKPEGFTLISTLHFVEPNVECHLPADLLSPEACARAIDEAMEEIISSSEPHQFPVRPAMHCQMCNFLGICPAGRDWLRSSRRGSNNLMKVVEAGR